MSEGASIWLAVTAPGPVARRVMRLGPSACMRTASWLMFSTMWTTSSSTPSGGRDSCTTPSICTAVTAAPCREERSTRRRLLPSVTPNPRSRGSATRRALRFASAPISICGFSGRISSFQFLSITDGCPSKRRIAGRICGPARGSTVLVYSDAPALWRPAAVVRNRGHVADGGDRHADRLQGAERRLAARTRTRDIDFQRLDAVFGGLAAGVLGRHLRGIGRRLTRPLEPHHAGAGPGNGVPLSVGDGDHGVVERGVHVRHARNHVLALATFDARRVLGHRDALLLLLAGDRLGGTLAGPGVGVRALAADRQALAVAKAAVAGQVHQPLDVDGGLATQVALDGEVAVDGFADLQHFLVGQLIDAAGVLDADLGGAVPRPGGGHAMGVLEAAYPAPVSPEIYARDTGPPQ